MKSNNSVVIPRSKVSISNLRFSILLILLLLLSVVAMFVIVILLTGGDLSRMLSPVYWPFYLVIAGSIVYGVLSAYYLNGYSIVDSRYLRVRDNTFVFPCKLDIQDIVKIDHLEYYSIFNRRRIALRIRFNNRRLIYRLPCELYVDDEDGLVSTLLGLNPSIKYSDEVEHDFRLVF